MDSPSVFEQYIARRQDIRDMLDHFGSLVFQTMLQLCEEYPLIDPVNEQVLMRAEHTKMPNGSIRVMMTTSNGRSFTCLFHANGEASVINTLGGDIISDEFVDFIRKASGETVLVIEEVEFPLRDYLFDWAVNAFEE